VCLRVCVGACARVRACVLSNYLSRLLTEIMAERSFLVLLLSGLASDFLAARILPRSLADSPSATDSCACLNALRLSLSCD
jgi:hypothetical protein